MSSISVISTGILLVMLLCIAAVLVGVFVLLRGGNRSASRAIDSYRKESEEAATRAGQRLLQADEILRAARDEADFAEASVGALRVAPFRQALASAETVLSTAFTDNARLAFLEGAEKTALAHSIIRSLDSVIPTLVDAQREFVDVRASEASVETRIKQASDLLTSFQTRISSAEEKIESLKTSYSTQALSAVETNPKLAAQLVQTAQEALLRASAEATSREVASQAVETAERALFTANQALNAVFNLETDMAAAADSLSEQIGSLTSDLADVERLKADGPAFAPLVAQARKAIDQAQKARQGQGNIVLASQTLTNAEADLDAALAPLRSKDEHEQRMKANAERYISLARKAVTDAERVISRVDRASSLDPYKDLSQARKDLRQAEYLAAFDPEAAMKAADQASMKARGVIMSAQSTMTSGVFTGGFAGSMVGDAAASSVSAQLYRFLSGDNSFSSPHANRASNITSGADFWAALENLNRGNRS